MNNYRFALLKYLMGAINVVSQDSKIFNNSLVFDVNKTDRMVVGLDVKSLMSKIEKDGWKVSNTGNNYVATAMRNDKECSLFVSVQPSFSMISTAAY
jgi:hypothetical protein